MKFDDKEVFFEFVSEACAIANKAPDVHVEFVAVMAGTRGFCTVRGKTSETDYGVSCCFVRLFDHIIIVDTIVRENSGWEYGAKICIDIRTPESLADLGFNIKNCQNIVLEANSEALRDRQLEGSSLGVLRNRLYTQDQTRPIGQAWKLGPQ